MKPGQSPPPVRRAGEVTPPEKEMPASASLFLLAVSLAGAALLAWWSLKFHQSNEQLWMVPTGLVMIGTPVVVWFSASASDAWRRIELSFTVPATAPDVEK